MATIGGREARKTRKTIQFQFQFVRICKDKGYKVFCNLFSHFLEYGKAMKIMIITDK